MKRATGARGTFAAALVFGQRSPQWCDHRGESVARKRWEDTHEPFHLVVDPANYHPTRIWVFGNNGREFQLSSGINPS
jgi:hypothetical protein